MLQISKCEKYERYKSNKCKKKKNQKGIFLPSLKVRKLFSIGKYQYQKHSLGVKKKKVSAHSIKKKTTKLQKVRIVEILYKL